MPRDDQFGKKLHKPSAKMIEAVRIGCIASDVHLTCSWPDCSCTTVPTAIQTAVEFAIRDAVKIILAR